MQPINGKSAQKSEYSALKSLEALSNLYCYPVVLAGLKSNIASTMPILCVYVAQVPCNVPPLWSVALTDTQHSPDALILQVQAHSVQLG